MRFLLKLLICGYFSRITAFAYSGSLGTNVQRAQGTLPGRFQQEATKLLTANRIFQLTDGEASLSEDNFHPQSIGSETDNVEINLPEIDVPILSDYLVKSTLDDVAVGPDGYLPVNITVIQKFGNIEDAILANETGQALFKEALALTLISLINGIEDDDVNIVYAIRNSSALYTSRRRLGTIADFIIKYSIILFSPSADIATMTTMVNTVSDELYNATVTGVFASLFLNNSLGIDGLSSVVIDTPPTVYLSSYPPFPQGALLVTQQVDNVMLFGSNQSVSSDNTTMSGGNIIMGGDNTTISSFADISIDNNGTLIDYFKNIIAGTVSSFLFDIASNDIDVTNVTMLSNQSYEVAYSIPLHMNHTYATVYAQLYQDILTDAVTQDLFTSQLQLAATPIYYNNSAFLTSTSTVLPSYSIHYLFSGNDTIVSGNETITTGNETITNGNETNTNMNITDTKSIKLTLPNIDVPILADYLIKSTLDDVAVGPDGYLPINITVIQKFGNIDDAIFTNETGQALFIEALALSLTSLISGIEDDDVNFIYAIRNSSALYTNRRRLGTIADFIIKYSIILFLPSADVVTMATIVNTVSDELYNATVTGVFASLFLNNSLGVDGLSGVVIDTPPTVYLSSYPPLSQGTLEVTQQVDDVMLFGSNQTASSNITTIGGTNSSSDNFTMIGDNNTSGIDNTTITSFADMTTEVPLIDYFKDIISGTVSSFLFGDTTTNDIKVQDVTMLTEQSYIIHYRIPLRMDPTYASVYAQLYEQIITDAVTTGLFTTQLQLAANASYYNNSAFLTSTASVLPTYTIQYINDGNETDINSGNTTRVIRGVVKFDQEIDHVDLDELNTPNGYNLFQLIFKEALVNSVYTISINDIEFYGARVKAGRRLRRELATLGDVIVSYGITLYSSINDTTTLETLTNQLIASLNDAITSGSFANAFISAAVTNNAATYTNANATSPPTVLSSGQPGTPSSTSTNKSNTTNSSTTLIIVLCILIPLFVFGLMYIAYKRYHSNRYSEVRMPLEKSYRR